MNFYSVILGLFLLTGLATIIWGFRSLSKAREQGRWKTVNGTITSAEIESPYDDLLPEIGFKYEIDQQVYEGQLQFPAGMTPMPEFSKQCVAKYSVGATVTVYVNPTKPSNATLEPNQNGGHGLIIMIGFLMLVLGLGALFFG